MASIGCDHESDDQGSKFCAVETVHRLFGEPDARAFQARFGGLHLYIPNNPARDHPISVVLGHPKALEFAAEVGGVQFYVPLGNSSASAARRAKILELSQSGKQLNEIARAVSCSQRCVAKHRTALRQLGLLPAAHNSRSRCSR